MTRSSFVLFAAILLPTVAIVRSATPQTLRYSLREESARGTMVGDVAVDAGLAETLPPSVLSQLVYSFSLARSPHHHLFNINEKTGFVTTAKVVDRDALCANLDECVVRLAVQILPAEYFAIVQVDVEIVDINDNVPQFPSDTLKFALTEVSMLGVSLSLPLADDPDSPEFAVKQYELVSDNDKFELIVVMEDGSPSDIHLVLRGKLDREQNDAYVLRLVALDGGTPPKSGSVTLNVDVIDVNDNCPVFENTTYRVSILENIDPSTVILNVKASDPDSGPSGEVVYSFSRKTQQRYGSLFDISKSGDISVTGRIDYEMKTNYVLIVSARNVDLSTSPVRAKVFIDVIDQNDNPPTINVNTLTESDSAQIPESSPIGTFIAHVTVIDEDSAENGRFNCSIHTPSFEIRQLYETEFKIVTSALLDREQRTEFVVNIECLDNGRSPRSSVEHLTVTIQDENDNAPVFSLNTYSADVLENGKPEMLVLTVSATDADAGRNSHFRYSLQPSMMEYFAVDGSNGRITTRRPFDRESTDKMEFKVYAIDSGSPQLTGTANVVIRIADVNDEFPRFSRSHYEFEVPENGPEVTEVGYVTAVDDDADVYNQFNYVIDPETNQHELFAIDSASGAISTTHTLDREMVPEYKLRVLAVPVGYTARTGTASVAIYIRDANDNVPDLVFPTAGNETVVVSSFTPVDYIIARLLAYDADTGLNGALSYGLDGGNDDGYFAVDNATGYVRVAKELRSIDLMTFVLSCVAEDGGQPRRRCVAQLSVVVNSSVAFPLSDAVTQSDHWVATIVSLVVITVSILLLVFCIAVVLFVRRRRFEAKTSQQSNMVMLEPRHLNGKTFAVHVRQPDRCSNDYSQLCEKQNLNNEHCPGIWTPENSFTQCMDSVAVSPLRNYDPLRQEKIRAADSRESLRSHDLLCDTKNGGTDTEGHRDGHLDDTTKSSRLQDTSSPDTTETQLSTGGDRVSVSGCSEDSKPDSGRGSSEDATSNGLGSPPHHTLKGPGAPPRPHQNAALKFEVRRKLVHHLQDGDADVLRNGHIHVQAPSKRRIRLASQV